MHDVADRVRITEQRRISFAPVESESAFLTRLPCCLKDDKDAMSLASQAPVPVLDLVGAERSSDQQLQTVPALERIYPRAPLVSSPHDQPNPSAPFEIAAMIFDRTNYSLGEPFNCELTLRYTGASPTEFPVATQAHVFQRSMPSSRAVGLTLAFDSPMTGRQLQVAEVLYGAPSIPTSLVTITTGQTIRFLMKGTWRFQQRGLGQIMWPLQLVPQLQVAYSDANSIYSVTQLGADAPISFNQQ
jgi:hypothetical protein